MAHFMNLDRGGSYALATVQQDPFTMAENAMLKYFVRIGNEHIVEDLVDINWGPETPAPLIVADEIGAEQEATAAGLKMFVEAGLLSPDVLVEQTLRQRLRLPSKLPDAPDEDEIDADTLAKLVTAAGTLIRSGSSRSGIGDRRRRRTRLGRLLGRQRHAGLAPDCGGLRGGRRRAGLPCGAAPGAQVWAHRRAWRG